MTLHLLISLLLLKHSSTRESPWGPPVPDLFALDRKLPDATQIMPSAPAIKLCFVLTQFQMSHEVLQSPEVEDL